MNNSINTNGACPHCKCTFDAKEAFLSFPGKKIGKRISLIFALCPECHDAFNQGNENRKISIRKTSYTNVDKNQHSDWTVTSSLALNYHFGDFFNAWWQGIDIPRPIFNAINDGLVEEVLPSFTAISTCLH